MTASPTSPDRTELDTAGLAEVLHHQAGVIARRQIVGGLGGHDFDIARMVRRRDLRVVHPGVYVNHTGPLTVRQREWVAVLACWPAALCHQSALPESARGESGQLHIAIGRHRTVRPPPDVRLHRMSHLDQRIEWNRSPPRQRIAEAAIDVITEKSTTSARFRVLADVCQSRQTTPEHLRTALANRSRVSDRRLLSNLVDDLATGACSVLEREYFRLERVHGLPEADRQQHDRLPSGSVYRDVPYAEFGVMVELDGRAFHDNALARDRDHERDLDTRVQSEAVTVRLTYGQVFERGCQTIAKVAVLLNRGGWAGPLRRCADCPAEE